MAYSSYSSAYSNPHPDPAEYSAYEALLLMKQNGRLSLSRKPVLFRVEKERVLVNGNGYALRLSFDDFLELYENERFIVRKERGGLDEKKDEEYYAWRARKQ